MKRTQHTELVLHNNTGRIHRQYSHVIIYPLQAVFKSDNESVECTHTHTYTHSHACVCTHPHMHVHTHIYTHMHAHIYMCMHAHTHVCAHTYTHAYVHSGKLTKMKPSLTDTPSRLSTESVCANRDRDRQTAGTAQPQVL